MEKIKIKEIDIFNIGAKVLLCVTNEMSYEDLRDKWKEIRNQLASEWQMRDISDFERWNFYLFYVVKDKNNIDRSLKYKIEHDTISSRKIIINQTEFQEDNYNTLITSYIKFNIKEIAPQKVIENFVINKSAQKLIENEN